jgi:PAS domain S-box-containing protein
MIDHTQEELPEGLTEFLAEEEHTSMKTDVDVSFKNRRYRTRFIHLNDASGRGVGDMVVMTDVTDLVTHLHTAVFTIAAICVGVGGFLFALLLLFLGRVERQMTIASKELIRVTKAVESTSDAAVIIDLSGQSIYQNQAFLELFGYTVEELNEAGGVSILYDDSEVFREVFEVIRRGDSWRGEVEMQTRDGRNVSISLRGDAVKEETGEILSYVGIHTDITERKRAEEAIRESEDRFRTLFNSATDAVFIHDFEGQMQEVNRLACDRLGYSRDELLQMKPKDFNAPEEASRIPERLKELQNKGYIRFESTHVNRNGKLIPVEIISRTISYKGKGMAISAARDITERKQAEEALRKVSEEQAILLDNIDTQIWYLRNLENHGAVNRALAEFLGVQKSDIAYKNIYDILSKEEAEVCIAGNREVFESKRQVRTEEWVKNGRGELRLLSISKTPKLDKDGNVEYVVCAAEDITERKQAEEALEQSEEKVRTFMDSATDLFAITDENENLVYVNKSMAESLEYSMDEMIGMHIAEVISEESMINFQTEMAELVTRGQLNIESTWLTKQGREIPGELNVNAIFDKDGKYIGSRGVFRDTSEHKQLAEELKEHRDHLQKLVEERTAELLETNEQLQQEITERKLAQERLLTYHKRLRSLASSLSLAEERERRRIATEVHDLIGQNLAFAKLKLATLLDSSSGSAREAVEEVNRLVDEAIRDSRFLVSELGAPVLYELGLVPAVEWLTQQTQKRHGITIDCEDDGQPKPLRDDVRILLFQAVRELLSNVVRHAKAQRTKVSITKNHDRIQIDVEDDGVGFTPGETITGGDENIFGLFSIRERLEPLGGYMKVSSEPGHGTHVTIMGPLKSES